MIKSPAGDLIFAFHGDSAKKARTLAVASFCQSWEVLEKRGYRCVNTETGEGIKALLKELRELRVENAKLRNAQSRVRRAVGAK